jgi:hypothetical protein
MIETTFNLSSCSIEKNIYNLKALSLSTLSQYNHVLTNILVSSNLNSKIFKQIGSFDGEDCFLCLLFYT